MSAGDSHGRIVSSLAAVGDCDDVFVDARRGHVYLLGGEGGVAVIAADGSDDYHEIARITTSPGARTGLFSPELGRLDVAAPGHDSRPAEVRVYSD